MPIRHDTTVPRSSLWNNDHVGGLDDLDDVTITTPATGATIVWNGSAWVDGDHGDLAGLGDDDHPQYTTEAEVIAIVTPVYFDCDSVTVTAGSVGAGDHTTVHERDATYLRIDEAGGVGPSLVATFAWSGLTAFNKVMFHGYYTGNHQVDLQIYNYTGAAWETLATLTNGLASPEAWSIDIADDTNYISAGAAQLRMYHPANGNAAHDLFIDWLVFSQAYGAAGGSIDHGELSGLADDDHPQYEHVITDVADLPTAELDDTLRLAPDGAGGLEWAVGSGGTPGADGATWFAQSAEPTANQAGDLWLDTDDGEVYEWSGAAWVSVGNITGPAGTNGTNGTDGADGADGTDGADGITWFAQSGAPTANQTGDLWLDTDDGVVYAWDGDSWEPVADITGPAGADGEDGAPGTTLHSELTDITADDHHDRSHDHSDSDDGSTLNPAAIYIPPPGMFEPDPMPPKKLVSSATLGTLTMGAGDGSGGSPFRDVIFVPLGDSDPEDLAFGATADPGDALKTARINHVHGMPADPTAGYGDIVTHDASEFALAGSDDLKSLLVDLSVTGAIDVDRDDAATHDLTMTGDTAITPIATTTSATESLDLRLVIRQDGTGGWALTWGGTITWSSGSAPTMPQGANDALTVGLLSLDEGATWLGFAVEAGAGDITTDPAWTAAGDQIVGTGDDTAAIVPVGDEDDVWTVVSGVPAWAPPTGGALTSAAIAALGFVGKIVMVDGITDPPEPLLTEDGTDYVYEDLP